ncbi:KTSC domain-containing protein [Ornithobacterium rhinotracheale]|uniref:KTSC domain-containing protein n=1 Tax=Ornithobacterium rhinotracheale TaxID=28251 RepID=UPI00129C42C2|nr:KTSC domain-containing protein [Ornithobacterium rhinotracheale]
MIPVRSSVIRAIDYNHSTMQLYINFRSGYTYVYHRVPKSVFNGLLRAPSKGKFFNRYIRGRFE